MKYLIVGLGNIGVEYEMTRHNVGFRVVERLAADSGVEFKDGRYGATCEVRVKGRTLILLKPSTYMNLSGNAVRYWMQQERIELTHLLIVVDELAFEVGKLQLRPRGSDGGHNGLKHIQAILGTDAYVRLRVGIGNDYPRGMQVEHVLGRFSAEEEAVLAPQIDEATKMCKSFCLAGLQTTMNQFNKKG